MPQHYKGPLAITFALLAFNQGSTATAQQALPEVSPSGVPLSESNLPAPPPLPPPNNSIYSTPSFFGGSAPSATSALGIPAFARSRVAAEEFLQKPLRWGPVIAHPHLGYGYTYATGVLVQPGELATTAVHTVSPGLGIETRHLLLDYTPSLNYYTKGPYDDTVNHDASLRASFTYGDWVFHLDQRYYNFSDPLIETGMQTTTEGFDTILAATWLFNDKIYFDFGLNQQFQSSENFKSSKTWSTMDWVNYRLTEKFSVGAGIGGGYTAVDQGSDMTYQQIQGRLTWQPSSKLSASLNGGIEIRQFLDYEDSDSMVDPLMGASINYQPFEFTSIYLLANHSVNTSIFADDVTVGTTVSGGVNQRFLKYLNLGLTGGYRNTDYKTAAIQGAENFPVTRQDEYTFVSATLGTTFLKRGTASIGYQHSNNKSTLEGYTYDSDQISIQLAYRY